jgi:hypothetical protein
MSRVPRVRLPLNIMCSKKWLMPVMPGLSFAEPTRATQPAETVASSGRTTARNFIPFESSKVSTGTFATSLPWTIAHPRRERMPKPARFMRRFYFRGCAESVLGSFPLREESCILFFWCFRSQSPPIPGGL